MSDLSKLSQLLLSKLPYDALLATVINPQPDTVAPHLLQSSPSPLSSLASSPDLSPELLLSLTSSRPGRKRKDAPPVDPIIAAQSRTLRNRFAAQRSRERKRQRQEQLEVRNKELEDQNLRLIERLNGMQDRIRTLQDTVQSLTKQTNKDDQTRLVFGLGTPAVRVRHTQTSTPPTTSIRRMGRVSTVLMKTACGQRPCAGNVQNRPINRCKRVCSLLRNPLTKQVTRQQRKRLSVCFLLARVQR